MPNLKLSEIRVAVARRTPAAEVTQMLRGRLWCGRSALQLPPRPPGHGAHRCNFYPHALSLPDSDGSSLARRQLLDRMDGNVVAQAGAVGTFQRGTEA